LGEPQHEKLWMRHLGVLSPLMRVDASGNVPPLKLVSNFIFYAKKTLQSKSFWVPYFIRHQK